MKGASGKRPAAEKHSQDQTHKQILPPRNKTARDVDIEERVRAAEERKTKGNAFFKDDKLAEAMQQYEKAIAHLGDDYMIELFGNYQESALAVKNSCHLNMAACLLKLKRYEEAISQCNTVLAQDENNAKALFRRGKAKAELGKTDAAREDFQEARKLAPEDKAIAKELHFLADQDKVIYQKQKELYKGIFGPSIQSDAVTKHGDDTNLETSYSQPKLTRRSRGKYLETAYQTGYNDHW